MKHLISDIFENDRQKLGLFLILSGVTAWLILILAILVITFLVPGFNYQRVSAIGTLLGALGAVIGLFFIGYQALQVKASLNLQRRAHKLETRPYVYARLEGFALTEGKKGAHHWFGGGNLYLRNESKIPASIIPNESQFMVASDESGVIEIVEWFEKAVGGFPYVTTVFPNQNDAFVPLHPIIGKKPTLLYIGALIAYTGAEPQDRYWYKFSQRYAIKWIKKANAKRKEEVVLADVMPLPPDHGWDRNVERGRPPKLQEPNWGYYLSQSYIKSFTDQ